jgi:hypothetical protein
MASSEGWQACSIEVESRSLRRGVNQVVVEWPARDEAPSDCITRIYETTVAHQLAGQRSLPDVYVAYGEIHAMCARASFVSVA